MQFRAGLLVRFSRLVLVSTMVALIHISLSVGATDAPAPSEPGAVRSRLDRIFCGLCHRLPHPRSRLRNRSKRATRLRSRNRSSGPGIKSPGDLGNPIPNRLNDEGLYGAYGFEALRDDGKPHLDALAETYVPELRGWKYPTLDSPRIRVRDLLNHTAGFVTDDPWGDRTRTSLPEPEFSRLPREGVPSARAPATAMEYSKPWLRSAGANHYQRVRASVRWRRLRIHFCSRSACESSGFLSMPPHVNVGHSVTAGRTIPGVSNRR